MNGNQPKDLKTPIITNSITLCALSGTEMLLIELDWEELERKLGTR
jgi:hypothetical protein